LGLAICRQFAQMLGGTVQAKSEPGKGSTFRVELLVESAEELQAGDAEAEIEAIVMVAPDRPPFRICEDCRSHRPQRTGGSRSTSRGPEIPVAIGCTPLDKERITEGSRLVSAGNPALGAELSRRADAFEFTPIMRAIRSGAAA